MAKQTLNTIKNWFKTGLKPTQQQFWDTWDSFWHKDQVIPASSIENLDVRFDEKADEEAFETHLSDLNAHNIGNLSIPAGSTNTLTGSSTRANLFYNTGDQVLYIHDGVEWRPAVEADLTQFYTKAEIDTLLAQSGTGSNLQMVATNGNVYKNDKAFIRVEQTDDFGSNYAGSGVSIMAPDYYNTNKGGIRFNTKYGTDREDVVMLSLPENSQSGATYGVYNLLLPLKDGTLVTSGDIGDKANLLGGNTFKGDQRLESNSALDEYSSFRLEDVHNGSYTQLTNNDLSFSNNSFISTINQTVLTANRIQNFQDKDGTIALLSDVTAAGSGYAKLSTRNDFYGEQYFNGTGIVAYILPGFFGTLNTNTSLTSNLNPDILFFGDGLGNGTSYAYGKITHNKFTYTLPDTGGRLLVDQNLTDQFSTKQNVQKAIYFTAFNRIIDMSTDIEMVNANGGNVIISLPELAAGGLYQNREVTIKKYDPSGNTVTINAFPGDDIEGQSSKVLYSQWDYITLVSAGNSYWIITSYGISAQPL
ncbi:hypothetical protein ACTJKC_24805 [Pedobacter sp. 22226]|uniref:hypothetical protein n=1 Tax=Pedobacter sp. 22226 TaxID=3453894 RepID=UPI003F85F87B